MLDAILRILALTRDPHPPATVLIRPLPPAASVRNPRVPSDYNSVIIILQGSLLVLSAPVNRSAGMAPYPGDRTL